jgi:hypothetical protein
VDQRIAEAERQRENLRHQEGPCLHAAVVGTYLEAPALVVETVLALVVVEIVLALVVVETALELVAETVLALVVVETAQELEAETAPVLELVEAETAPVLEQVEVESLQEPAVYLAKQHRAVETDRRDPVERCC